MKRLVFLAVLATLASGCAYTTAVPVGYTDRTTEGVRVYDPQMLLVVTCENVQVTAVPDYQRGYALQAKAYLAKNEATFKTTEGLLGEVDTKLDTTGLLSLLQGLGETALEQAGNLAALGASVSGSLKGMEGVWLLRVDDYGAVADLRQLAKANCSPAAGGGAAAAPAPDAGAKAPKKGP